MSFFALELGKTLVTVALSTVLAETIKNSRRKPGETEDSTVGVIMDEYDIIGDDYGFIGEDFDFIDGDDDDDLLDALSVSGGADYSEIVGATVTPVKRRAQQRKAALRQLAMRQAGAVVQRKFDKKRRYPMGFVPTSVPASSTASVPASPQNLFRPERLVIPSDIAFDFGVRDIKVGNMSQFVQSVEVPAALFSEVAINTNVTFDTAAIGNQVSLDLRNKTAGAVEFTAGLVGTIAK